MNRIESVGRDRGSMIVGQAHRLLTLGIGNRSDRPTNFHSPKHQCDHAYLPLLCSGEDRGEGDP